MQRPVDKFHDFARLLVYSIGPDGQALRDLAKFMHATESFYHPSNVGAWSRGLSHFLSGLGSCLARRVHVRLLLHVNSRGQADGCAGGV